MNEQRRTWLRLGEHEYRTLTLYTMEWKPMKLSECMMAISKYGGPLVVLPWDVDAQNYIPQLHIYTLAGSLLSIIEVSQATEKKPFKHHIDRTHG
jgi:hypothetical protein